MPIRRDYPISLTGDDSVVPDTIHALFFGTEKYKLFHQAGYDEIPHAHSNLPGSGENVFKALENMERPFFVFKAGRDKDEQYALNMDYRPRIAFNHQSIMEKGPFTENELGFISVETPTYPKGNGYLRSFMVYKDYKVIEANFNKRIIEEANKRATLRQSRIHDGNPNEFPGDSDWRNKHRSPHGKKENDPFSWIGERTGRTKT